MLYEVITVPPLVHHLRRSVELAVGEVDRLGHLARGEERRLLAVQESYNFV